MVERDKAAGGRDQYPDADPLQSYISRSRQTVPACLGQWPKGPNGPDERFAVTGRWMRIRVSG
jgi:hypothetical protein